MSSCSTSKKNKAKVVSKYFVSEKPVMDESLTDFQEPKKNVKGPKNNYTSKIAKPRKKPLKIKGQKDIKSALKKNVLVEYTEDFNRICQESGIDIDAEQLALAIALSKSLQDTEPSKESDTDQGVPSTSQQRSGKIRSTLLEYGFKVPEGKIKAKVNRRLKDFKKKSVLLLKSNEEKLQNIADRYSQVVFESLTIPAQIDDSKDGIESSSLFFKATSAKYEVLKDDCTFYVENLINREPNTIGSLLKDWSLIPGRPASPKIKLREVQPITNMKLTNEEMDTILSRKIVEAQSLVDEKSKLFLAQLSKKPDKETKRKDKVIFDNKCEEILEIQNKSSNTEEFSFIPLDDIANERVIIARSPSPDLFDDDISEVNDGDLNSTAVHKKYSSHYSKSPRLRTSLQELSITNELNKSGETVINLTENDHHCYVNVSNTVVTISDQLSYSIDEKIDLTQHSDEDNDVTIVNDLRKIKAQEDNRFIMDSSDDEETLPLVELSGQKQSSDNIKDLSLVKNSESILECVVVSGDDNFSKEDLNATKSVENDKSLRISTSSNYDEFYYNHSNESNCAKTVDLTDIEDKILEGNDNHEIDLTQKSDSSLISQQDHLELNNIVSEVYEDAISKPECIDQNTPDMQSNNYSIEIVNDETLLNKIYLSQSIANSSQNSASRDEVSEIFEISDEELNYSIHKSKFNLSQESTPEIDSQGHNFDVGGLSVLDNLSSRHTTANQSEILNFNLTKNKEAYNLNNSKNDSYLPDVVIAGTKPKTISITKDIAKKSLEETCTNKVVCHTPKNKDVIIKTSEVTPMLDYAALSTPERNNELDKYGLKPLKRKRAIQLLTHLYNQTHPIVEACSENDHIHQSPAKKLKTKPTILPRSPIKPASPRKSAEKRGSATNGSDTEVLYEITNFPNLNEVDCEPDDWVFQKREKAKVHTCRVPLHIAFYNYVSSSQSLREAILRYDPVNIDVIHKDLVGFGHKYDPKDLLRFMDKKCITVKTTDNNTRNEKKCKNKL